MSFITILAPLSMKGPKLLSIPSNKAIIRVITAFITVPDDSVITVAMVSITATINSPTDPNRPINPSINISIAAIIAATEVAVSPAKVTNPVPNNARPPPIRAIAAPNPTSAALNANIGAAAGANNILAPATTPKVTANLPRLLISSPQVIVDSSCIGLITRVSEVAISAIESDPLIVPLAKLAATTNAVIAPVIAPRPLTKSFHLISPNSFKGGTIILIAAAIIVNPAPADIIPDPLANLEIGRAHV